MKRVPIYAAPGRRHTTMVVDFGNPFLRDYFPKWLGAHEEHLAAIRTALPRWAAEGAAGETTRTAKGQGPARPLAMTLDIDGIILCNMHFAVYREGGVDFGVADHFRDPATGKAWRRTDPNNPIYPGAAALVETAAKIGARPILVSGRRESTREETVANLERVGLTAPAGPFDPRVLRDVRGGILWLRPDHDDRASARPYKEGVREKISRTHRIIANVGDQASDLGYYGDNQYLIWHPFYFIY